MTPAKINYKIYQGSTFNEVYRWESGTLGYAKIIGITKSAPCVISLESPISMPIGWRFRIGGVAGMKEINNTGDSFYIATSVNQANNTITVNQVNSSNYNSYTTGGVLEYNVPVDISIYKARMQIRETAYSEEVIFSATTENGFLAVNTEFSTISINIPAAATSGFTFDTAVYSIELYDDQGFVVPFAAGALTLVPEITR